MPGPLNEIGDNFKWRVTVLLQTAAPEQRQIFVTEVNRLFERCSAIKPVSNARINDAPGRVTARFDLEGGLDQDQCDLLRTRISVFRGRVEGQTGQELTWDPPNSRGIAKLGINDP
jgi:hypothetical protein